ncbi:hypothetical protein KC320_g9425 [Hortaea werneckii]|nr:hypothetical protein KC320_g9425 [Hortaea werneckii]
MDSIADDLATTLLAGLEGLVAILMPWNWILSNASQKEEACAEPRGITHETAAGERCNQLTGPNLEQLQMIAQTVAAQDDSSSEDEYTDDEEPDDLEISTFTI